MAMTTVMVLVESTVLGRQAMEAGFRVARPDGGHVVGVYPVPDAERLTPESMYFARASVVAMDHDVQVLLDSAERGGGAGVEGARLAFEDAANRAGADFLNHPPNPGQLTAAFKSMTTGGAEAVAEEGRVFDLVVVPQPRKDPDNRLRKILRAVLFNAGRPVLVVPAQPAPTVAKRPLIAWNGSALSARAAAISRNFFGGADEVGILTVHAKAHSGPTAHDLAEYIAWHNIAATVIEVEQGSRKLGEVILAEAAAFEADMLAMGAYSHGPFRESLTGGVTNYILSHCELPILMTC